MYNHVCLIRSYHGIAVKVGQRAQLILHDHAPHFDVILEHYHSRLPKQFDLNLYIQRPVSIYVEEFIDKWLLKRYILGFRLKPPKRK